MNIPWLAAWTTISGWALLGQRCTAARLEKGCALAHPHALVTAQFNETDQTGMATAPCAALMGLSERAETVARTVLTEEGYAVVTLGSDPETFDLLAGDDYAVVLCVLPNQGFRGSRLPRLMRLLGLSAAFIVIDGEDDPPWLEYQQDAGAWTVLIAPLQARSLRDALTHIRTRPPRWHKGSVKITPVEMASIIDPRSILGVPARIVFRIARSMLEVTERLMAEAHEGTWPRVAVMARMLRGMADCVGARSLMTVCNLLETLCQATDTQARWPTLRQALETAIDHTLDALWLTQRESGNWFIAVTAPKQVTQQPDEG